MLFPAIPRWGPLLVAVSGPSLILAEGLGCRSPQFLDDVLGWAASLDASPSVIHIEPRGRKWATTLWGEMRRQIPSLILLHLTPHTASLDQLVVVGIFAGVGGGLCSVCDCGVRRVRSRVLVFSVAFVVPFVVALVCVLVWVIRVCLRCVSGSRCL